LSKPKPPPHGQASPEIQRTRKSIVPCNHLHGTLEKVKASFFTLCFPFSCTICEGSATRPLCESCLKDLHSHPYCHRCADPLDLLGCFKCSKEFQCSGFKVLGTYPSLKTFILNGKSQPLLKNLDSLSTLPWNSLVPKTFLEEPTDILFIPPRRPRHWLLDHWQRYCRAFNPVLNWNLSFSPFALRNPSKMSQKFLKRDARIINSLNLFQKVDDFQRTSEQVLLVDDVLSTGASLKTCISILRKLGYKRLYVFILAFQGHGTRRNSYGSG
jgi:predicted amidophosphoribosyltransferase